LRGRVHTGSWNGSPPPPGPKAGKVYRVVRSEPGGAGLCLLLHGITSGLFFFLPPAGHALLRPPGLQEPPGPVDPAGLRFLFLPWPWLDVGLQGQEPGARSQQ
jgi:hypothetical protein